MALSRQDYISMGRTIRDCGLPVDTRRVIADAFLEMFQEEQKSLRHLEYFYALATQATD